MKVHLKLPDGQETAVNLNLIPRTGESIDLGGVRYVITAVVHTVETSKITLELLRLTAEEGFRTLRFNEMVRYRTSDIAAFSPPIRARF
ncbi:MAG: hypothetical protein HY735_36285 [Verrucomicrobia bacterium]|nr:hypothetical protein [Verrucomicrobiota bacterium]